MSQIDASGEASCVAAGGHQDPEGAAKAPSSGLCCFCTAAWKTAAGIAPKSEECDEIVENSKISSFRISLFTNVRTHNIVESQI